MRYRILLTFLVLFLAYRGFSQVYVTSSDSISCTQRTTTLNAFLTGDSPVDAGIDTDDAYSLVPIPIGFTYNFYGVNYTKCLIGANGLLCFDTTLAGMFENWMITAALAGNADVRNCICGPWCDIDFADFGGTCTISTTGTAPYRKFIVTFCRCAMYDNTRCAGEYTNTQIIIYETTNIAEVHIGHKTICTAWNSGRAIVGVQNASGSASTAAPGRDFPSTWSVVDEAWRFTPTGGGSSYAVSSIPYAPVPYASSAIYWYNATTNTYLGTGTSITVSPTTTTTYKAGGIGCADTSFGYYTVVPSGFVNATLTSVSPSVCQGTDGSITLSGLNPGLVDTVYYQFNGSARGPIISTVTAAGTITLTGLSAGNYTNLVVYEAACETPPLSVTLNNPPITVTVLAKTDPTVCGYSDGTITLTGLVPATTYTITYDFNGTGSAPRTFRSNGAGALTITGLAAGIYTNIASTGGPCPTTIAGPATLNNPAPPVVTVDSPLVKTCIGNPEALHAYVTPTGIPYNYSWSPASYLSSTTIYNPIVNPGAAGDFNYTITVNPGTDPTCAATANVRVHVLPPFVLNNHDTEICRGQSVRGSVTGSSEFSYLWTPATGVSNTRITNPTITPTMSETYVVTASYAHCPDQSERFTIRLDTPARPVTITDTICLGMTDVFDFSVPGAASSGNYYHYQWQAPGSADVSNDTLPNVGITPTTLGSHSYSLLISPNAAFCTATDIVNILVLPNAIGVRPTDSMICLGNAVQAIGYGGDPIFTYQWIPTAGIAVSNVFNAFIRPDTSALYTVTASFHRCPDITATLNLSVQPTPTVFAGGNKIMCQFDTLHLRAQVLPEWYGAYSYAWTPATDLDHSDRQTVVFYGNTTTKLYVTVTTPSGCTGIDSTVITVNPGNFASLTPDNNAFCPHASASIVPTAPSGTTYHWYPSWYLSDSLGSAPVISPIASQVYTVVATSPDGCKDTLKYTATVYPAALILLTDSIDIYPGESYHIQPGSNCSSFQWFPPAGLSETTVSDPVATPEISTLYKVRGITDNGCEVTDSITINVHPESLLELPNAFSPGTGENNRFTILRRGIAYLEYFRVFNRWGNMLFETKNIDEGWDGAWKGTPQPLGVYVYEVKAMTSAGATFTKHGNVTLLR